MYLSIDGMVKRNCSHSSVSPSSKKGMVKFPKRALLARGDMLRGHFQARGDMLKGHFK